MSNSQPRLELLIDVFAHHQQRALAMPDLTPPELVEAILNEFTELEYLGDNPADYFLLKASDRTPLDDQRPLAEQLGDKDQIILCEKATALPENARRLTKPVYLREQSTGKVYRLTWQPAIIGRQGSQPTGSVLAVNLASHTTGLRVSRRHAQIIEKNGQHCIESLSPNPTSIRDSQGNSTPVTDKPHPLKPGDSIYLDNSDITLKYILRDQEAGA